MAADGVAEAGRPPEAAQGGADASRRRERRRTRRRLLSLLPRKKHLRDTWLHRRHGDALFAPALWKPERKALAGGLAVGVFIALTPTPGVQMILAAMAAIALRVNLPVAVAACWVTNPATAETTPLPPPNFMANE